MTLSLEQVDQLVGGLPDSARLYREWWSNSPQGRWYAKFWMDAGFLATPHLERSIVEFTRSINSTAEATDVGLDTAATPAPSVNVPTPFRNADREPSKADGVIERIGLIGCVKSKQDIPAAAKDLYTAVLFRGRRHFVENSCSRYYIISAKYGLVHPDEIIAPYDVAMAQLPVHERQLWAQHVIRDLELALGDLSSFTFEIHAGYSYRHFGLVEGLVAAGANVEEVAGDLKMGEQLTFYSAPSGAAQTIPEPRLPRGRSGYERIADFLDSVDLDDVTVTFDDLESAIGRLLPPSATHHVPWWANSATNPQSRDWVKRGWRAHHPRPSLRTVGFRRALPPSPRDESTAKPSPPPRRRESSAQPLSSEESSKLVGLLLEHAARSKERPTGAAVSYTPDAQANDLVVTDPFAFLIAVIFDQGITAERAWNAPYLLKQRLGYFEPVRMATDAEAVRLAIQEPPMLHRFKENMARWITNAAGVVVDQYGGDASAIWSDSPTAVELQWRLVAFDGIGQKKAAMAVELLERDLGVEIRELDGSDIAFDVHIRRVLLRTGLADRDVLVDMVGRARELHPERPGSLDHPLWDIGRRWCRPRNPDCSSCPLHASCPQWIDRSDGVKGVGQTHAN